MTNGLWSETDSRILDFTGVNFVTSPLVNSGNWQNMYTDPQVCWEKVVDRRNREKDSKYKVCWNRVAFEVLVFSTGGLLCHNFDMFVQRIASVIANKERKKGVQAKIRQRIHYIIVSASHAALREYGRIYRYAR